MCYVIKLKAILIQHCCGTLCARGMFQEVRIVVYDYHDSKSVRYSSIFLTHCVKNAKGGTVWQLHKDQCQYAVSYTRRQTSSSVILWESKFHVQNVHLSTTVNSSKLESNLTHSNRYLELETFVVGKYALTSDQICTVFCSSCLYILLQTLCMCT
jgi:hypothetical protein